LQSADRGVSEPDMGANKTKPPTVCCRKPRQALKISAVAALFCVLAISNSHAVCLNPVRVRFDSLNASIAGNQKIIFIQVADRSNGDKPFFAFHRHPDWKGDSGFYANDGKGSIFFRIGYSGSYWHRGGISSFSQTQIFEHQARHPGMSRTKRFDWMIDDWDNRRTNTIYLIRVTCDYELSDSIQPVLNMAALARWAIQSAADSTRNLWDSMPEGQRAYWRNVQALYSTKSIRIAPDDFAGFLK
jgi:hypothetical protein